MDISAILDRLERRLRRLRFAPPVTHVYNPLVYARAAFTQYLDMYGRGSRRCVLLGMNPGPWGMAQTGVPFGEVGHVRDWLGIDAEIRRPRNEHPKRPVQGLDCPRSEVSGARLWGWARHQFGTPARFFREFIVLNYCPLVFMEESGRNLTPDKLPAAERDPLHAACDEALAALLSHYRPQLVIGVGAYAEKCLTRVTGTLDGRIEPPRIGRILHPSPASPAANRDWAGQVTEQLRGLGALPAEKP